MPFGCHVAKINYVVSRQLSLDINVPVIARGVTKMAVKQNWSERRPVRNDGRRRGVFHNSGYQFPTEGTVESIVDRLKRKMLVILLKWRITSRIPEQIPEHTVM